jgi:parallel beta-helix repeat protein
MSLFEYTGQYIHGIVPSVRNPIGSVKCNHPVFKIRNSLLTTLVVLLLISSLFGILIPTAQGDLTPHGSIRIVGDAGFTSANGVSSGNGSESDPYIVEDLIVSSSDSPNILIRNTQSHLVIRNVVITNESGARRGIELENVANVTIENVTTIWQGRALRLEGCANIKVMNCSFNTGSIYAEYTKDLWIENVTINKSTGNRYDDCIQAHNSDRCTIIDCRLSDSTNSGIDFKTSTNLTIVDNVVLNVSWAGIRIWGDEIIGEGYQVHDNTLMGFGEGIRLRKIRGANLTGNVLDSMKSYGDPIWMRNCSFTKAINNSLAPNGIYLHAESLDDATMVCQNNSVNDLPIVYWYRQKGKKMPTEVAQAILVDCEDCVVSNVNPSVARVPLMLYYNLRTTVENCTIVNKVFGLISRGGKEDVIRDCHFLYTEVDLCLGNLSVVINNRFDRVKLAPNGCNGLLIEKNVFNRSGINEKKTYLTFWTEVRGPRNNYTIDNNTMIGGSIYIDRFIINDISIINNDISGNGSSIVLGGGGHNNTISKNTIANGSISTREFINGEISNNTVSGGMTGINTYGIEDSVVAGNRISSCSFEGVHLQGQGVTFTGNVIMNCDDVGLLVWGNSNEIYHNVFIDNNNGTEPRYPSQGSSWVAQNNLWDNGKEGNYWSDYEDRYPYVTNDGYIWNKPYRIEGRTGSGEQDRYPLVHGVDLHPPIARAGDYVEIFVGDTAYLDGTGSSDDLGIKSYKWQFEYGGETIERTGPTMSFYFGVPGIFVVTLEVTDISGKIGLDLIVVTVVDNVPPNLIIDAPSRVKEDIPFTLSATNSTDEDPLFKSRGSVQWSISGPSGDLDLSGFEVRVILKTPGMHQVNVTCLDPTWNRMSRKLSIEVIDTTAPLAKVSNMTVDMGEEFELRGSRCMDNGPQFPENASFEWTIHFDTVDIVHTGFNVSLRIDEPGNFTCDLMVVDAAGNMETTTFWIRVRDVSAPIAVAGDDVVIRPGGTVLLDGSRSTDNHRISVYEWTIALEDDVVLENSRVEYTFEDIGNYLVTLRVTDTEGNSATDTLWVNVTPTVLTLTLSSPPNGTIVNRTVTISGEVESDVPTVVLSHRLLGSDGEEVREWQSFDTSGLFSFELDLTGFKADNYTLEVSLDDGHNNVVSSSLVLIVPHIDPGNGNGNGGNGGNGQNGNGGDDVDSDDGFPFSIIIGIIIIVAVIVGILAWRVNLRRER